MSVLRDLVAGIRGGGIEVVDLTAPPTGAVIGAGPLPIVGGSGSPVRVLALGER
ncbi:hypothetical protein [Microtetraspora sp. NBRC 16547]|uniref:hypothetical protein n=1 Tax=Microtetraspora sp. NBRC 16547 TaxID=3030993 RepID=UPI0024A5ED29|nr:hypothetical protein [Microtetraspora sp. NBRC 16547]GLW96805.1 hypothetical protein Misp02_08920 [Microtetraspora sp. NBRC 16547]